MDRFSCTSASPTYHQPIVISGKVSFSVDPTWERIGREIRYGWLLAHSDFSAGTNALMANIALMEKLSLNKFGSSNFWIGGSDFL